MPMLAIEGMRVGIQIVGQRHADARTTGIARWLLETMKPVSEDYVDPYLLSCEVITTQQHPRPAPTRPKQSVSTKEG